jgi:hypothetical protein
MMSLKRLSLETGYVQQVLEDTMEEISADATFGSLVEAVEKSGQRAGEKKIIR